MQHKITNIVWDVPSSMQASMPKTTFIELDFHADFGNMTSEQYAQVESLIAGSFELEQPIKSFEIGREPTPQQFAKLIDDACRYGHLVFDHRGATVLMAAVGVASRDMQLNALYYKIEQLLESGRPQQVELYPDGTINELSFGVLWYEAIPTFAGAPYYERKNGKEARCFMQGGLIYRGPERSGYNHLTTHEWSVHT